MPLVDEYEMPSWFNILIPISSKHLLKFQRFMLNIHVNVKGKAGWLSGKESTCQAGAAGLIPGLGRSPGEANGNPLQYPCRENLMDRGAWWAAVHGVPKSRTRPSD